jgi:branched-chain amino acid transport system permease protein
MGLFLGTVVSGLGISLVYGLLAFAFVTLYKATGIANFAQGQTGVLAVFIALPLIRRALLPVGLLLIVIIATGAVLGIASYLFAQRIRETENHTNLIVRTLAIYLLMTAVMTDRWAAGEPYKVPSIAPAGSVPVGGVNVSYLSLESAGIALVLGVGVWLLFNRTRQGLLFRGIAANREVARLLGVRVRWFDLTAWGVIGGITGLVAMIVAPADYLTTGMLDVLLLYAFTSAVIGGLDSLGAAWVGGLLVGLVSNITSIYLNSDMSLLATFGLLVTVLILRPQGIAGSKRIQRL